MSTKYLGLLPLFEAFKRSLDRGLVECIHPCSLLHFRVLKLLADHPQVTPQTIARQFGRDKAQITRLVNELVCQGLITRAPHPDDRRSWVLQLTAEGQTIYIRGKKAEQAVFTRMTEGFTDSELNRLQHWFSQMQQNLQQPPKA